MPVPTEFGAARNSRKRSALGVEIIVTLTRESVQYFTMRLQVAGGSFLAVELEREMLELDEASMSRIRLD